jgi:single-stranded DNA-binding protein
MASNGHWIMAIGIVASVPEQRFIPQDDGTSTPVVQFKLAVNERRKIFGDRKGNKQDYVTWYRVTVLGNQVDGCYKYLSKGDLVHVMGRPGLSVWKNQNTGKAYGYITIQSYDVRFIRVSNDPDEEQDPKQILLQPDMFEEKED